MTFLGFQLRQVLAASPAPPACSLLAVAALVQRCLDGGSGGVPQLCPALPCTFTGSGPQGRTSGDAALTF